MRSVQFVIIIFALIFACANCGSSNGEFSQSDFDQLGQWLFQKSDGQWILAPGGLPDGVSAANGSSQNVVEDKQESAPLASNQALVTGTVLYKDFPGGIFSIVAQNAKSCPNGLCPDLGAVPAASTTLSEPGYYTLIVPKDTSGLFLVVSHQQDGKAPNLKEDYLGPVSDRLDGRDFDFSPEDSTPPPPPPPPPSGPTDIVSPWD